MTTNRDVKTPKTLPVSPSLRHPISHPRLVDHSKERAPDEIAVEQNVYTVDTFCQIS
jgi:hypothetical protein